MSPLLLTNCGRAASESGHAAAPTPEPDWRGFHDFLRRQAADGRFSGAVAVAKGWKGGKPLLEEGYAMADRRRREPNTARTTFNIASMGKMFTAVAIAQLVQRGKLSFDDPMGEHVRGFPREIAGEVTLHHLLTHTAGMGDVLRRGPGHEPPRTIGALMKLIAKEPLAFEPGSQMSYSNSGFIVLGAIVQQVSGQDYGDYLSKHVFKPARMTATAIRAYRPADVPGMAHPYAESGEDLGREIRVATPAGGASSTVGDMIGFARALMAHRLLNRKLTETVITGKVQASGPGRGPDDKYAYGFGVRKVNGARVIGHNGGSPGYEANLDIYPDLGYAVVILANQDRVIRPASRKSEEIITA
ncbi:serine hydrolase domain-containing protein [Nonomuraea diastatica]|uniref:serine hydrolase domain-containing protein n=1 Tax=Nonomuraea diastatica TaxID=1848329 RepID=UPI0014080DE7|nr:serine hydrolase domain-containing protein [Nonomuraea diastatica]